MALEAGQDILILRLLLPPLDFFFFFFPNTQRISHLSCSMKEPFSQHAFCSDFDALVQGRVAERLRRLCNERRRPLTVGGAGGGN